MVRLTGTLALACALAAPALAQDAPTKPDTATIARKNAVLNAPLPPDQAALKSHVMFLASDAMKGRDTGSPEYDIAAQYVAAQFYAQGLKPAGDNGSYLQHVPLVSYRPEGNGTFAITRPGAQPVTLTFGDDYVPGADPSKPVTTITAPVVFVGWGITAPQFKRDDYKGVDVKGKIVAFFGGAPSAYPGEERAHFGSAATKAAAAFARGAVAVITLESPSMAQARPVRAAGNDRPRVIWAEKDGSGHLAAGIPSLGSLTMAGAAKLFAGARTPWTRVAAAAASDDATFKAEQLPGTLSVSLKTEIKPIDSANVAGLLEGSDPRLKNEVVVYSAHLDHIGVGKPVNGDSIYNGAMDNAVGIASLIEEARRFKESGKPPRRSILFLAVTAEEKGLVGSDYYANHPTLPKSSLVADVNLDMPIITYKFTDVIAFGAQHSSIGATVQKAAESMGLTRGDDPMPEEGFFVRSDHYRFVQQGIPAVFLWPGMAGPNKAAAEKFLATNYHKPSDEVVQEAPILWDQGVRFVEINYAIARGLADADERPRWNKGDFFGQLYNGYGAR